MTPSNAEPPSAAGRHGGPRADHVDPPRLRLRRLNIVGMLVIFGPVGVLIVAFFSQTWLDVVILGAGAIAGLLGALRWSVDDLDRVAVPCLLVTAAVWFYGALFSDAAPAAFYGLTIVGPLIVSARRHRARAAVALASYVAAVGVARVVIATDDLIADLIGYVVYPTGLVLATIGLMAANRRFYELFTEVEEARDREGEIAVARERARFSSELHDIQGHTLHVVKLKIALARKLMRTDVDRAEQELREVHALVGDTITQTRELAYAQRRLNLAAELENAKNLFEAAGIRVRVVRSADVDARVDELLGQVLRETTTNILRHAQAREVRITLSETGIAIVNDGASEESPPRLRGLATLRDRLASEGGELTVEQDGAVFSTAARLPPPRVGSTVRSAVPDVRKDAR
ncbi:two-component system sensor histidine kinase DesK [Actinoalloteichus hoggarensis]|uniref:Sensor histidine kinase DesK n=1 Tax=Actinoalloteichus hoggarensis TaxID=1470176 RepID=A0A221VYQ6_9PSEU|nr:histidine kinase [Actinoalloteichus hoggarensis]ASO18666.1 Sensor histidine kinase DesK [Actinoalloteichus hoggarensis]MBB5919897.1 two-component system sensor histidine kinase DesK [Actinoalloteichus hoggarensis]